MNAGSWALGMPTQITRRSGSSSMMSITSLDPAGVLGGPLRGVVGSVAWPTTHSARTSPAPLGHGSVRPWASLPPNVTMTMSGSLVASVSRRWAGQSWKSGRASPDDTT